LAQEWLDAAVTFIAPYECNVIQGGSQSLPPVNHITSSDARGHQQHPKTRHKIITPLKQYSSWSEERDAIQTTL